MTKLTSLSNIGKEMARKLETVQIDSAHKLKETGARTAFSRLKEAYPNVCLVHLYALEGAIRGVAYDELPQEVKKELKAYSDGLKMKKSD